MTKADSSQKAFQIIKKQISTEVEEVWVLALNSELRLIDKDLLFRGTVNKCTLHARDIFKYLCKFNAVAFILVHSHPSGNTLPSGPDHHVTKQLFFASQIMEIPLIDHLIVSKVNYFSFADIGLIEKYKNLRTFRLT